MASETRLGLSFQAASAWVLNDRRVALELIAVQQMGAAGYDDHHDKENDRPLDVQRPHE